MGILGPNGGGKTTLFKIILGLLPKYQGEVRVSCSYPNADHNKIHHSCMGYVPQKAKINRFFPATVYDTIEMGLYGFQGFLGPSQKEEDYINWLIKNHGLENIKNKSINELSGGQLQRTLMAKALVTKPSLLLLDEPLVGIDQGGVKNILQLLLDLKNKLDLTILMISHDYQALKAIADEVACVNGVVHFHKNVEHFDLEELFGSHSCSYDLFSQIEKNRKKEPPENGNV